MPSHSYQELKATGAKFRYTYCDGNVERATQKDWILLIQVRCNLYVLMNA